MQIKYDPNKTKLQKTNRARIGMSMQSILNNALITRAPQNPGTVQGDTTVQPNNWGRSK